MYLIRWRYKANSLLNKTEEDTPWYDQFVEDESEALRVYREKKITGEDFEIEVLAFELRPIG